MKKINYILILAASMSFIIACSNNSETSDAGNHESETISASPDPENSPAIIAPEGNTQPAVSGVNPPHGEPGHRHDIPDGTPAPSSPSSSEPAAPSTPTVAGMNPAHGESGHDCSIPVGSPLKK